MKGLDTNLRLQASPQLSNVFLPKRLTLVRNLNFRSSSSSSPAMLKLFSSRVHHLTPAIRPGPRSSVDSPLFKALSQLTGLNRRSSSLGHRVFFCSDSASEAEAAAEVAEAEAKVAEAEAEVADSKSSSAIVSTNPKPEDCLTVSSICTQRLSFFLFLFPGKCVKVVTLLARWLIQPHSC